ncbi:MAG TPA: hypothetical protein VGF75_08050 [Candidatus Saccharimonadales bacterium]|jgi:hypothetical protein
MKPTPFIPGQAGPIASQQQTNLVDTVDNGIEFAYDNTRDSNSWADTFSFGNMSGVMLRVAGTGHTPPAGNVNWTSTNTKIPHNLGWIPMGFLVTYKSGACDVHAGTTAPDAQFIYLTITDDTVDTNLFIF